MFANFDENGNCLGFTKYQKNKNSIGVNREQYKRLSNLPGGVRPFLENGEIKEINVEVPDVVDVVDPVLEIRLKRQAEYPPIGDQLDAIMKWAFTENEISLPAELKSLAAKCMSVKAKYPIED